ncbi:hypothetical protein Cgig2_004412 [Carnegiea gigantea]|uniref:Reverse transcriptase zinc-binding domain-containing protein n=1 Tax=Carnegiea gigantea TaxID=171969 RepID=A0A9Q1JK73_9CARY|nr:hypothetical protein Cgig2_004412 [Carnegiea gigantea]
MRQIFLACDADLILSIPLYDTWPADKLIWHYHPQALFSVRPAHHSLISNALARLGPPCMRLLRWRVATSVLPCTTAIAKRVSSFSMSCSICSHIGETDTHAVLECPLASQVWQGCGIDSSLWASAFHTLADCLDNARKSLDKDHFGDFLAIMWER